jgi:hypothetical protein
MRAEIVGRPTQQPAESVERCCAKEIAMSKRELIDTGTDKRYVRRDDQGRFKESVDVGKSLAADRRVKAKTVAKKGEGDKGDRPSR